MINADQPDGQPGKALKSTRQIQLYTTNELLKHPLVSPVLAYLGGLPPLLVIASDREVLRDEILYTSVLLCYEESWAL
jgi:acetyl esterase/lipase